MSRKLQVGGFCQWARDGASPKCSQGASQAA